MKYVLTTLRRRRPYQGYGYLLLSGLDDEPVPVHGDHQDREGGEEDAGGLETAQQFADKLLKTATSTMSTNTVCSHHIWSQNPVLGDDVKHGEGHGEEAEQEVGDGQVGDEDIPGSKQHLSTEFSSSIFIHKLVN